ncbi:MAG: 5-formyltetrahydrofolate cyclo-ligase, partial [Pseudomonadota bacterium]|nr:5-formyltetrahydrofolate cyclo-ligase [Pseudomonadota bacterium]
MTQLDTSNLRKTLRQKRQSLTSEQQALHSEQACQHLMDFDGIKKAERIALFLSQDGELSTQKAIEQLWLLKGIEVYLPA